MSRKGHRTQTRAPKQANPFKHYVKELRRCDWFVGTDLRRLMRVSGDADSAVFLVRRLENGEMIGRCDACVRRHSFSSLRCGMNLATRRVYANCFYDFRTREPIPGRWHLVDSSWQRGSMGVEHWRRVAPTAPTATGGLLRDSLAG